MLKWLAAAAAVLAVALPLALILVVAVAADPGQALTDLADGPSVAAMSTIPPAYLAWYMDAGRTCPGLPWSVLAGIGTVESDNGRSHAPGVHSGANSAGAEGPMQFLPATLRGYAVDADRTAPLTPYDPADAIYTAAAMLCANGAATGTPTGIRHAVFAYNHSAAYVREVMAWAAKYTIPASSQAAVTAVAFALRQVGKPYQFSWGPGGQLMLGPYVCPAQGAVAGGSASATRMVHAGLDLAQRCAALRVILYAAGQLGKPYQWGATGPDTFDCSGLTMMAYRAAGMYIPRTSQQQWAFGRQVAAGEVMPGDLVFFAGSDGTMTSPGHVGIVLGEGLMVDAPFTGADVRVEPYAGAADLVGFTRPGPG